MEIGGFFHTRDQRIQHVARLIPRENALIISNSDFEKDTHGVQKDVEK